MVDPTDDPEVLAHTLLSRLHRAATQRSEKGVYRKAAGHPVEIRTASVLAITRDVSAELETYRTPLREDVTDKIGARLGLGRAKIRTIFSEARLHGRISPGACWAEYFRALERYG